MRFTSIIFFVFLMHSYCLDAKTFDARLSEFEYPFKVQMHEFSSQNQDLEMAYMDINSQQKETVVLLHGKNFSGFYWEDVSNDLVKKGYRVIVPDQIGFGKSSKPLHYQYSFTQLSLNTALLLDALGIDDFTLVGHSMGGMLAVTMADQYPNRIKHTILINPIGAEDYTKYVQYKDPQFFYKNELNKTKDKIISYQKKNYYDGKWNTRYEALVTPFAMQLGHPDWPKVAWNNALTYGPIFSESIIDKLARQQKPIHIILGTRDRTGPGRNWKKEGVDHKLGQYQLMKPILEKLSPYISVIELSDLGHLPHFEDYERFAKVFYPLFEGITKE